MNIYLSPAIEEAKDLVSVTAELRMLADGPVLKCQSSGLGKPFLLLNCRPCSGDGMRDDIEYESKSDTDVE